MGKNSEKYYKWKLKKEKEEEKIYRVSAKYLELIILYTSLLFIVLAQWYLPSEVTNIVLSSRPILLFSSILSTISLLCALISNFLMRFSKSITEIPEEVIHRVSLGYLFFSILFLSVFLLNLNEIEVLSYLSSDIYNISILIVLLVFIHMLFMSWVEKNKTRIRRYF